MSEQSDHQFCNHLLLIHPDTKQLQEYQQYLFLLLLPEPAPLLEDFPVHLPYYYLLQRLPHQPDPCLLRFLPLLPDLALLNHQLRHHLHLQSPNRPQNLYFHRHHPDRPQLRCHLLFHQLYLHLLLHLNCLFQTLLPDFSHPLFLSQIQPHHPFP